MAFQKTLLPECPHCKQPGLRVIESRQTHFSTRRRKQCDYCKERFTTHEVTSDFFEEAKRNLFLVSQFYKLLNTTPAQTQQEPYMCTDCKHNNGEQCAYDFPEYDTSESSDCTWYES
jgi:uncharacterized protein YbaR (Trm112 family)